MQAKKSCLAAIAVLLSGCQSLRGVPIGVNSTDRAALSGDPSLATILSTASTLQGRYQNARDKNLEYAYWSNATLIPTAAGAASAGAYKGSKDLVAGIGIFAGSLIGFNSFTNARANAKVYQSGITALDCFNTNVSPFTKRVNIFNDIVNRRNNLNDNIDRASNDLKEAQSASNASELMLALKANPTTVTDLANAEATLTTAIANAKSASLAATQEAQRGYELTTFATSRLMQIDGTVASKISQSDVSYSQLVGQMTPTQQPKPPSGAAPAGGGVHVVSRVQAWRERATANDATLLAITAQELLADAAGLDSASTDLGNAVAAFGLNASEQNLDACIKNM